MFLTLPPAAFCQRLQPVISLITCAPGSNIYELEGHTVLRIQSGADDYVISWGLFDFNAPAFVYRFVKGETDYMCGIIPTSRFIPQYSRDNRTVTEQVLNLDSAQTARIIDLCMTALLPQNRVYRYNYVKDNCATRPLDIIEQAAGKSITLPEPENAYAGDTPTYRNVMKYWHRNYPWYQFGIDLALGNGIDDIITTRQLAFAPVLLQQMAAGATIGDKPMVTDTVILSEGTDATFPPTPWYLTPNTVSILILILVAAITIRDITRRRTTKWLQALIFAIFGITGSVITFLVFFSAHEATSPNYLLLWLNPLCFIVPLCITFKKCKNFLICYQIVNFAAVFLTLPVMIFANQTVNTAFIPLVVSDLLLSTSYILINGCYLTRKNFSRTSCSA